MENLFMYIVKASGLITLFSIAYYLFLKKETFFTLIRFFLIAGIITSFVLPLITITKIVWIPHSTLPEITQIASANTIETVHVQPSVTETFYIDWWYITAGIYILGVAFFLIRLGIDLYKVASLLKNQNTIKDGKFKLIDTTDNTSPFSFFSYIVFNSASLTHNELNAIVTHEKVHSSQLHSLDMIVSQLTCALLWFNPVSWLYKKQVAQNLEFIADAEATKRICDTKGYQKTLLKITLEPQCIAITNHFYQSLIKKRIIMLNKKQSKKLNIIRFAFVIPILVSYIYLFQTEVVAKEKAVINYKSSNYAPHTESPVPSVANQIAADTTKNSKIVALKHDEARTENVANTQQEKKQIIVVNGIIQNGKDEIVLTGKEVNITNLTGEEAVKIYGDKAKYGAIVYTTVDFDPNSTEPKITSVTQTSTRTEKRTKINTSITDNVKELNGGSSRLVTVTTLQDRDGNIIKNDENTIYFVINNTTTDIQLNGYKEDLEKAGITTTYSDIKRNSIGKIISIKIALADKKSKSKTTGSWDIQKSDTAIPDIYIGKIKGKLTVTSAE